MKVNIKNNTIVLLVASSMVMPAMVSCIDEPDSSNLYQSLELTIEQTLESDPDLTAFNAILKKTIYANTLSTYGNYTCFAPTNDGVSEYLDSLYNDAACDGVTKPLHNGITETADFESLDVLEKVNLMPTSLCVDLAKYHLSGDECSMLTYNPSEESGQSWSTLLVGRNIPLGMPSTGEHAGQMRLGPDSYIISGDITCSNGLIQKLDRMIRREDRLLSEQMNIDPNFSLFAEALKATGLDKELLIEKKDTVYTYAETNPTDRESPKHTLYCPTECKIKYTVFAESNDVFANAGIHTFEDLVNKCKEWYGNPTWYDYVSEKAVNISTGSDYTNEWNVLHMFVAYHILRVGMPVNQIVYEKTADNASVWNVSFGYEPQEYFETMLPNTLMKIWATNPNSQNMNPKLWINRYRLNNTLTEEYGTLGKDETHPIVYQGVPIDRSYNKETLNGYIHKIGDILLYDEKTVSSLQERMRFDSSTFLYELTNNGIRSAKSSTISKWNGGGDGTRVAFDVNYFDNIVCYNPNTILRFCVLGAWRAKNSDQMQGWDSYDFAIKLPHVPTGDYELRIIYPPMIRSGLMQFYIGESSKQSDMVAQGTPFDARLQPDEHPELFGYVKIDAEAGEYGIEADQAMHIRGYMYGPASFSRAGSNSVTTKLSITNGDPYSACKEMKGATSCRTELGYGTSMLRHVICTQRFKQGTDYWLRIKNVGDANEQLGWSFDFVELVPTSIVNSQTMMEDWY